MSWLEKLYQTYENNYGKKEISQNEDGKRRKKGLVPLFHKYQKAHIEITIDSEGNFIDAQSIEKSDREIIIPCTEESASRTSGDAPFPLCDKIHYIAKDYSGNKRSLFHLYYDLLKCWAEFDKENKMLQAVFKYVSKGNVCEDLSKTGKDFFEENKDIKEFGDLLVRWRVYIPGEPEDRCWLNETLQQSWIKFNSQTEKIVDLCLAKGTLEPIALTHPKGVRYSGDGGKLISSNDKSNFTFKGRFLIDKIDVGGKKEDVVKQPATISEEVSHKAHSALQWLIDLQGYRYGDQAIVSWSVTGEETPKITDDSLSLFDQSEEDLYEEAKNSYQETAQHFARKLNQKISGYKSDLSNSAGIVVMGLDSAGPGRISITFYRELNGSDFIHRVEKWHSDMAWYNLTFFEAKDPKTKKKHSGYLTYAPAPPKIAEACYGKNIDEKLKKITVEKLLPCIVDQAPVPVDLVAQAVKRASNKISMEWWEWENTLSVACSLYKAFTIRNLNNQTLKPFDMALEHDRTERDYLYGRLLAVAEYLEEQALYVAEEKRETTVARLMQRFADFPFSTWRSIELALTPYKSRLHSNRPKTLFILKNLLDEIHSKFQPGDFESDARLTGAYLLGYHCQRLELRQVKSKEEQEKEEEQQ